MAEELLQTTFAELIERGILEIGDGYRAKLDELGGAGPLFFRAGLLTEHGIDWSRAERFHANLIPQLASKIGRAGDTIVTTKGNSVGRSGYIPAQSPQFVYSPHLSYWRSIDFSRLLPGFLRYWSQSPAFAMQLRAMADSTDMAPYLSLSDQRSLMISLPDVSVQHVIVDMLGALDEKIAVNDRLAATAEELSIARATQGLTSTIPLGGIAYHIRDQIDPATVEANLVAHYSLPAFDAKQLPDLVAPGSIRSGKFVVSKPSLLLSKLNPSIPRIWNVAPAQDVLAVASTEFVVLHSIPGISPDDLWAVCGQPDFLGRLTAKATGTSNSHQRVSPADLLATRVIDPRAMSNAVHSLISALAEQVRHAHAESLSLAELRDSLLPRLMSGEIRVRDAEKIVEDTT